MEILDFLPITCAVSYAKRRQHIIAMFKTQNLENVVTTGVHRPYRPQILRRHCTCTSKWGTSRGNGVA